MNGRRGGEKKGVGRREREREEGKRKGKPQKGREGMEKRVRESGRGDRKVGQRVLYNIYLLITTQVYLITYLIRVVLSLWVSSC